MKYFIFLLFFGITFSQKLSKREVRQDIEYFLREAEKIHPDLYAKVSKEEIRKEAEKLLDSFGDSISAKEVSKKLFAWSALFRDGHTRIYLENSFWQKLKTRKYRFPFSIQIKNEEFYVASSEFSFLKKGDKVLSINNVPAKDLLKLSKYVSSEVPGLKQELLAKRFNLYFFIEYGPLKDDSISLRIHRDGEKMSLRLPLRFPSQTSGRPYSFRWFGDSVGVLKVLHFGFRGKTKKAFGTFLDSVFKELRSRNTEILFVDLRKNGGGSESIGMQIFSYLGIPEYKPRQLYQMKVSKAEKRMVRKYFLKWYMYPFYPLLLLHPTLRKMLHGKNGKIYSLPTKANKIKTVKNPYQGNVCVLTSINTYSAAADFVSAFAYSKRGKLAGERTGQPRRGFIDIIFITLPNSELRAGVSYKIYEYEGTTPQNADQGITPDIFVSDKEDQAFYKEVLRRISGK